MEKKDNNEPSSEKKTPEKELQDSADMKVDVEELKMQQLEESKELGTDKEN